ncbi:MAG: class I SAM-dependent RNA methyltransferase [Planctomycetes bacterium]|nr:class I SAM-dependent RNA methyltransferase [Planctomycetota bacterium]
MTSQETVPGRTWSLGDELVLEIESLCSGGEGLGRVDGLAVFVPYAAPGDSARVRVERVEKRFLRARIVELVSPSSVRRAPRCAHFGTCGGCAWQHVEYAAQRAAKGEIVREALQRVGGIAWERAIEVLYAGEWGWRARAELHAGVLPSGERVLGFRAANSRGIVALEECPVLLPAAEERIARYRAARRVEPASGRKASRARGAKPTSAGKGKAGSKEERIFLGVGDDGRTVLAGGQPASGADEDPVVEQTFLGSTYGFAADGFFQAHRALAPTLVERALGDAQGALAFDLYAGAGLFTLPLARRFSRVVAVESAKASVALGRENARRNRLENARFEHDDVEPWLTRTERARPDFVLLDPPRSGAGSAVVGALTALGPKRIAYVSCDPATLARDLRVFVEGGYALTDVVALDLFPQTPHVECVAHLVRLA